ncbi:sugar-binding transcriptional regulator [Alicyclobacillus suci]|uniref:sugar-binding transcriptional regulator n=1 Tax=Alicyclobacillus suci TaxID=2816080 RepID=UPI001A8C3C00|nr:sugar-binding transcriptional regulator [Alicyclobacillus suci]
MIDGEEEKMLRTVSTLYYIEDLTQQEIAKKLSLSRQRVNRLLKRAKEEGIVQISISNTSNDLLERELEKRFKLTEVQICSRESSNLASDIGKMAYSTLMRRARSSSIVGLSWGNTLSNMIRWCEVADNNFEDITVVQLNGGLTRSISATGAGHLLETIGNALNAEVYQLMVPAIVDSSEICKNLQNESAVKDVLAMARDADIALFSVGIPDTNSVLSIAGYLDKSELVTLTEEKGAVGDICSRYFTEDGNVAWDDLDERTIGITLNELRKIPQKICVSFGEQKASAVYAALRSQYIDVLIVDSGLAHSLLMLDDVQKGADAGENYERVSVSKGRARRG